jgi:hypothetical protein
MGGTGVSAMDSALTLPHMLPSALAGEVAPAVAKLVKAGSRCSTARWPGGRPVELAGVELAPVTTRRVMLLSVNEAGPPLRIIFTSARPGVVVRVPPASVASSWWTGFRCASISVWSAAYHQSRSLLPL